MSEAQIKKAVAELLKGGSAQDVRVVLLKAKVKQKDLDKVFDSACDFFEQHPNGKKEYLIGFCLEAYRDLYKAFRNGEGKGKEKIEKNFEGALRTIVEITKLIKLLPNTKKPEIPTEQESEITQGETKTPTKPKPEKHPLDIELDDLINEVRTGKG